MKPLGNDLGKKNVNGPSGAFKVASQIDASATSRNPQALLSSAMQAGRFVSGKGIKIADLTNGGSLYLFKK